MVVTLTYENTLKTKTAQELNISQRTGTCWLRNNEFKGFSSSLRLKMSLLAAFIRICIFYLIQLLLGCHVHLQKYSLLTYKKHRNVCIHKTFYLTEIIYLFFKRFPCIANVTLTKCRMNYKVIVDSNILNKLCPVQSYSKSSCKSVRVRSGQCVIGKWPLNRP